MWRRWFTPNEPAPVLLDQRITKPVDAVYHPKTADEPTLRQTYVANVASEAPTTRRVGIASVGVEPVPPFTNVGPGAPKPASRRERKLLPVKQRLAENEETISLLGAALLRMRSDLEQYLGKPVARDILPRG